MRVAPKLALMALGMSLSACVTAPALVTREAQEESDSRVWGYGIGDYQLKGKDLDKALANAEKHPLGSAQNPVRVFEPDGEKAYLARLRCADGGRPDYVRRGNVGIGVFGNIIDLYDVNCHSAKPGKVEIYMDMYFTGKGEQRPVPGFTIVK